MSNPQALVQKLWNYCNNPRLGQSLARSPTREYAGTREKPRLTLRDDGLSYGDYVEQLTFLLFLKMADEQARLRGTPSAVPKGFSCPALLKLDGDDLETHYRHTLEELGKRPGMLGVIFRNVHSRDYSVWMI